METPDIVCYSDGYYRHTIYGLGPYIADYPEQVLLACIVQGWCPRLAIRSFLYQFDSYMLFYRCDAKWDNLDDNIAGQRSHKLTCSLIAALDKKLLWDDYGTVSNIMVCQAVEQTAAYPHHVNLSRLPMAFLMWTFTSCYRWTFSTRLLKAHSKIT